jgi:hypothetical protein
MKYQEDDFVGFICDQPNKKNSVKLFANITEIEMS